MKKVLFVVGSLRQGSFSLDLAKKAEQLLKDKVEVSYLDYKDVPLMNQDLETPVLPQVQAVRDAVEAADLVWIFSPVYNSFIPGTVKNLLDWLSRSLDLSDTTGPSIVNNKKFTVSVTAAVFHQEVIAQYKALLPFIRTQVVGEFSAVKIDGNAWTSGTLTLDEDTQRALETQVQTVLNSLA